MTFLLISINVIGRKVILLMAALAEFEQSVGFATVNPVTTELNLTYKYVLNFALLDLVSRNPSKALFTESIGPLARK